MADWPLYTWDGGSRRYKDARRRFVPRSDVRAALDRAIDAAQADMLAASRELQAGAIETGEWQVRMAAGLKRSHVMAAALAKGGWAQADSADWRLVAARVRSQYGYLRDFAYQVANGLPLDGQFLNRAGMYANSAIQTYEKILRIDDLAAGMTEERRILHSEESCFPAGTLIETIRGPIPIENVRVGDLALTRRGYRRVARLFRKNYRGPLIAVRAGARRVACTPNHPFATLRGWVEARSLLSGDDAVVFEEEPDHVRLHVAIPDPEDDVTASCKVGIAGRIPYLLVPLSVVQRLETGMAMPPLSVGLDDQIPYPNVDDEAPLDDNLGFVNDPEFIKDAVEPSFQSAGLILLEPGHAVPHLGDDVGSAPHLVTDAFGSTGKTGWVGFSHPRPADLTRYPSPCLAGHQDSEGLRPGPDLDFALPDKLGDRRRTLGGINVTDDLVHLGRITKERPGGGGATPAPLGVIQFLRAASRAYRGLLRRILAKAAGTADRLIPLAPMSADGARHFVRPRSLFPRPATRTERFNPLAEMPTNRASVPYPAMPALRGDFHSSVSYSIPIAVYNLEVEDVHEYIANGFVVHNCNSCVRYAALGWQPAGTLPDIGEASECLTNDRCSFERRVAAAMSSPDLIETPAVAFAGPRDATARAFAADLPKPRPAAFDSPPLASAWEPRP